MIYRCHFVPWRTDYMTMVYSAEWMGAPLGRRHSRSCPQWWQSILSSCRRLVVSVTVTNTLSPVYKINVIDKSHVKGGDMVWASHCRMSPGLSCGRVQGTYQGIEALNEHYNSCSKNRDTSQDTRSLGAGQLFGYIITPHVQKREGSFLEVNSFSRRVSPLVFREFPSHL